MQAGLPPTLIVMLAVISASALVLAWLVRDRTARRPGWRDVENVLGLFFVLGMLYASASQVIVRYGLSEVIDIPWTEEFSRLLLVWTALWGAAIVQRDGDHIAMSVLYDFLPVPLQRAVLILGDLVALSVLGVIAWYGWTTAQRQMGMSTVSLGVPIAVFILPVALGGTIMFVHTLVLMGRHLRGRAVPASAASSEL